MTKLIIFSDCHYGSPGKFPYPGELEYGENVIHTGDIFEFKNIRKKYVRLLTNNYRCYLKKCRDTKTITMACNHGVSVVQFYNGNYGCIKEIDGKRIWVTHGHRYYYSKKTYTKWENKKPGKSKWFLKWIERKNGSFKESSYQKPSQYIIDKIVKEARQHGCQYALWGHTHRYYRGTHDGVDLINVGRGRTEIDL